MDGDLSGFCVGFQQVYVAIDDQAALGGSVMSPAPEVGAKIAVLAMEIHVAPGEKNSAMVAMIRWSDVGDALTADCIDRMETAGVVTRERNVVRLPREVSEDRLAIAGFE